MAKNQKQIIYDLDVSLSVVNLTRSQVAKNRRSIMDLIEVIQKLDIKILKMQKMFFFSKVHKVRTICSHIFTILNDQGILKL